MGNRDSTSSIEGGTSAGRVTLIGPLRPGGIMGQLGRAAALELSPLLAAAVVLVEGRGILLRVVTVGGTRERVLFQGEPSSSESSSEMALSRKSSMLERSLAPEGDLAASPPPPLLHSRVKRDRLLQVIRQILHLVNLFKT